MKFKIFIKIIIIVIIFISFCNNSSYCKEIGKTSRDDLVVFTSERLIIDSIYSEKLKKFIYLEKNQQKFLDNFKSFRVLRDFVTNHENSKLQLLLVNKISPVEFSSFGIRSEGNEIPFADFCIITIDTVNSKFKNKIKVFYLDSSNIIKDVEIYLSDYMSNLIVGNQFTNNISVEGLPFMFDILMLKIDGINYYTKFYLPRFWRFPPECEFANVDNYFYKDDSLHLYYFLQQLYKKGIFKNKFGCKDNDYIIKHSERKINK